MSQSAALAKTAIWNDRNVGNIPNGMPVLDYLKSFPLLEQRGDHILGRIDLILSLMTERVLIPKENLGLLYELSGQNLLVDSYPSAVLGTAEALDASLKYIEFLKSPLEERVSEIDRQFRWVTRETGMVMLPMTGIDALRLFTWAEGFGWTNEPSA